MQHVSPSHRNDQTSFSPGEPSRIPFVPGAPTWVPTNHHVLIMDKPADLRGDTRYTASVEHQKQGPVAFRASAGRWYSGADSASHPATVESASRAATAFEHVLETVPGTDRKFGLLPSNVRSGHYWLGVKQDPDLKDDAPIRKQMWQGEIDSAPQAIRDLIEAVQAIEPGGGGKEPVLGD